jgi:hypothetical protein
MKLQTNMKMGSFMSIAGEGVVIGDAESVRP